MWIPRAIRTIIRVKSTNKNSITFNRRDNQAFFSPFLLSLPLNLDAGRESNEQSISTKKKLLHNWQERRGRRGCNRRMQHATRLHRSKKKCIEKGPHVIQTKCPPQPVLWKFASSQIISKREVANLFLSRRQSKATQWLQKLSRKFLSFST